MASDASSDDDSDVFSLPEDCEYEWEYSSDDDDDVGNEYEVETDDFPEAENETPAATELPARLLPIQGSHGIVPVI